MYIYISYIYSIYLPGKPGRPRPPLGPCGPWLPVSPSCPSRPGGPGGPGKPLGPGGHDLHVGGRMLLHWKIVIVFLLCIQLQWKLEAKWWLWRKSRYCFIFLFHVYINWKCNFPMSPSVLLLVGQLADGYVCHNFKKGGKLHLHARGN